MHRSHSHPDVRHTLTHYYHLFLRLSKRYFWYFLAWKVISFFIFARIVMPWLAGSPSVAYVTVVATADYAEPACVAAFSLLASGTRHPLVALVPSAQFAALAPTLRRVFNEVIAVEPLSNPNLDMVRPEYSQTYTKLRIWGLTQYSRVLFFDSDVLFIQSVDDLFERPAAPVLAAEECCGLFNSGLMLLQPSQATLSAMIQQIPSLPSYDGGDAGFLNSFYADKWVALPWEYNAQQSEFTAYKRQWEHQWKRARVLHYTGEKPWNSKNPTYETLHKQWHVRRDEMKQRGLL